METLVLNVNVVMTMDDVFTMYLRSRFVPKMYTKKKQKSAESKLKSRWWADYRELAIPESYY